MKTTVEIPDDLFREARLYAVRNGVPLHKLIARGLRMVVAPKTPANAKFRLKTFTTRGEGLICDDNWSTIRSLIEEGHGG